MKCVLTVLCLLLPVLAGVLIKLPKLTKKQQSLGAVGVLFVSALMALATLLFKDDSPIVIWSITQNVKIALALDGMSRFYVIFVALIWLLVGIYAVEYTEEDENSARFFRYYLISFTALIGLAMSANLVTLYMFYEMMTLATVPLVAHNMDREAVGAAVKYLIYSVFGASCALLGIFFIGAHAQTFDFAAGGLFTQEALGENADTLKIIAFIMIMGFSVKAGMFPMHSWLPTAHPVAPAPASAVLSGVITKMGVLGIIRSIFYVFGANFLRGTWVQYTFMILSLITVVMGSMLAYKEKVFKKRLAYSTVSQVSYVLFGLSTMTEIGFIGACLHIVFHSLIKNTLFMSAGAVIHKTGKTHVEDLDGIGKQMPITMTMFTVVALGLIGIPPTGGFISKWNLARGAFATGLSCAWIGPAMLLVSAILTAAYLLSVSIKAFFRGGDLIEKNDVGLKMLVPMGICAVLSVVLGIIPGWLISFFQAIASTIL